MAMVTFGVAYAVLAYVAQQAVEHYHWVQPCEMLDGLGMAETTPGPLIMVLQFVGFMAAYRDPGALSPMLAGTLGGLSATWVTFTPCFLWIFVGGPYIETLRGNKGLAGALSAITAAVVGVILNLSIWFALHTVFVKRHGCARSCCPSTCPSCRASISPRWCWRSPRRPRCSGSISVCSRCWRARAPREYCCGWRG
jgi:chromate transport protein ChrA